MFCRTFIRRLFLTFTLDKKRDSDTNEIKIKGQNFHEKTDKKEEKET